MIRHLPFFAHILHGGQSRHKPYWIYEVEVGRSGTQKQPSTRLLSPLNLLALLGLAFTIVLIAFAIDLGDGMAVVAVSLLSTTSALSGLSWRWGRSIEANDPFSNYPPRKVVIRWPNGSFLLVHTNDGILRELYTNREGCSYNIIGEQYQAIVGTGVILLILSIVALSNCEWEMQAAIALAYTVMHILYWFVAMLPMKWVWDMSMFTIKPKNEEDMRSYIRVVSKLIKLTQSVEWVLKSEIVPDNPVWREWIREAERECMNERWDSSLAFAKAEKAVQNSATVLVNNTPSLELKTNAS